MTKKNKPKWKLRTVFYFITMILLPIHNSHYMFFPCLLASVPYKMILHIADCSYSIKTLMRQQTKIFKK